MPTTTYYDIRFKFPWSLYGYTKNDVVAFSKLTGYKRFTVGVSPDRTFNYLQIRDEAGHIKTETELSDISYAGLEALILWRLSTPLTVLNSMAMICLGLRGERADWSAPSRSTRLDVQDDSFLVDFSRIPVEEFEGLKACLMLVEQRSDRVAQSDPTKRELLLFARR